LVKSNNVHVAAGVIDRDYRGNVGIMLLNLSREDFKVTKGMRIAQLILEKIAIPPVVEVDTLSDTVRGAGGFGSTGIDRLILIDGPTGVIVAPLVGKDVGSVGIDIGATPAAVGGIGAGTGSVGAAVGGIGATLSSIGAAVGSMGSIVASMGSIGAVTGSVGAAH
jgi:hypothetical protein